MLGDDTMNSNDLNLNINPSEKLLHALKEADYIEKHPDDFKGYNNVDELFEELEKKE